MKRKSTQAWKFCLFSRRSVTPDAASRRNAGVECETKRRWGPPVPVPPSLIHRCWMGACHDLHHYYF